MKASRTLFLFLLVATLGGWIYFHERHQVSSAQQRENLRKAFDPDIERLTHIGIRRGDYSIDLRRDGDAWFLEEPKGAPAHLPSIRQLLSRLRSLDRGELITPADMRERSQTLADFGLVVPRLILTLGDSRGQREYRVGDPNPLGNSLYVKEEGSQNVMLVSTDLLDILPEDPDRFRDRRLTPLDERDITALVLSGPDGFLRLERKEQAWVFAEPAAVNADDALVNKLVSLLLNARIETFINRLDPRLDTGLTTQPAVIRVHTRGREVPYEISVGGPVDGAPGFSYARIGGQDGLLSVSTGVRDLALTRADGLRDRRVLPVSMNDIVDIAVLEGERKLRLLRNGDEWSLQTPGERPASALRVGRMIERWQSAQIEAFLPADPQASALTTVTFGVRSPLTGIPLAFDVLAGNVPPGRAWLRPAGSSEIWQVVPDLLRFSPADPMPYLSREMLRFDPARVIRVTLRSTNNTSVVLRASAAASPWTSPDPARAPDAEKIDAMLRLASTLQAEDLVEVQPASLEAYGLQTPSASLSLGLDGEAPGNRTILFHAGPERLSALIQGQDVVFRPFLEQYQILTGDGWNPPAPAPVLENEDVPPANAAP